MEMDRCTFQFGFNKRAAVEGLTTRGYGHQGNLLTYNAKYLNHRSKMIMWAISARRQVMKFMFKIMSFTFKMMNFVLKNDECWQRWPEEEPYV